MESHRFLAQLDQSYWFEVTSQQNQICSLDYAAPPAGSSAATPPLLKEAAQQITAYLKGNLKQFDLPLAQLDPAYSAPPFQRSVWQALLRIPYGEKMSYKQIATEVNNPKAVRAVGGANRANPLPIIIPCHRVVAQGKQLAPHYSFGGVRAQEYLLFLEQRHATL